MCFRHRGHCNEQKSSQGTYSLVVEERKETHKYDKSNNDKCYLKSSNRVKRNRLGSLRTPLMRKYLSSDFKEVREQARQISGGEAF